MKRLLLFGIVAYCLTMEMAVASEKIIRVRTTVDELVLTVETIIGESYQLQCCSSLVTGEWTDLGVDFFAVSTNTLCTVTTSESHCFFQVVRAPGNQSNEEPPPPPLPPPPPPE